MRIPAILATLLLSCAAALAVEDWAQPWRPQARVLVDPPAWYSPALFALKDKPQPGEWMAAHPEKPLSFQEYVASAPVRPIKSRHTIVVSALGNMPAKDLERLPVLREFLELFFTLPTRIGPPLPLDGVTTRDRSPRRQYLSTNILSKVLEPRVSQDVLCLLGVTMEDLYPEPSWNYVFGQASLGTRVGVYSLVRFYPVFWNQPESEDAERRGLRRGFQTLVHETGHMFGVPHCQKYECAMNGSNSLQESDTQPLHLCPDCLRMFRWNTGFDIIPRYEGLKKFFEAHDMKDEAQWLGKRIRECRGEKAPPAPASPSESGPAKQP